MTSCTHCEALRDRQAAFLQEHNRSSLPRWGEDRDLDAAAHAERWGYGESTAAIGSCSCRCHAPARMVGVLPRLNPTLA